MRNERLPYDDSGHLIARAFGGSIYFNSRLL
ncbi:DNA/RNA non-specific endonuclease [Staphylococcus epidermidis]|nr:DNA/RNA non-specific endonuclease [Staphylococcus epidermidis]MEB7072900.1 DNA/RNA non-specific endonuclease [Staphylococcus epidermidis]